MRIQGQSDNVRGTSYSLSKEATLTKAENPTEFTMMAKTDKTAAMNSDNLEAMGNGN